MDFTTSALLASWVAIFLLGLVVSALIRQVQQLSRQQAGTPVRRAGPRPGEPAPGLAGLARRPVGDGRSENDDGRGGQDMATVLLFLSPSCRVCAQVLAEADSRVRASGSEGPAVHVLYAEAAPDDGTPRAVPVSTGRSDLFTLYDAVATPFAVVVGADERVLRSQPLGSVGALRTLLDSITPPGDAAPATVPVSRGTTPTVPSGAAGPPERTRSAR
ncbi:hypothetical protein [Streptomyces otsuchiensis]|uniref:hypothetical protein n=1 Tax=Streptomyces otsuchiensis TaxID=2681388 RepID=UPI001D132115|nr:hypothetical protein [Streptomyces otsuchiensis]